jgi:cysteine-rich repeat protein
MIVIYEDESYCINKCGDGILALEYEECEDGNNVSKDGCSSICEIEKNWKCYIVD